jgi:hypothetical protein
MGQGDPGGQDQGGVMLNGTPMAAVINLYGKPMPERIEPSGQG